MNIFKRKPLDVLLREAGDTETGLKKTFTSFSLIALGLGAIIGAGLFSITGMAAANFAGPAIMISFVIAAIGCAFAGLCYAEFASIIPVAGSAYTYSYATMGEFIAWIIGWDLVLEYAVGAATVASSWSGYLSELFKSFGVNLPPHLLAGPFEQLKLADGSMITGMINLPAVFIVTIMSMVLIRGTSQSRWVNNIIVVLKVTIVVVFIVLGMKFIRPENLTPFIPENTGTFGKFGFSGIIRAAAIVFFAYIGFDAVSTAAQETKNPKVAMPIGILGSLIITTILYILFAYVLVGVAPYTMYGHTQTGSPLAPIAIAIENMGEWQNGKIVPAYPWLNTSIIIAILLGYSSVILVMLLGQSRVFYTMSKDGLVPKLFSTLHPKFRTPYVSNIVFLVLIASFAAFIPGHIVGEMTSIGTLFAFILVCIGILVMRKTMPEAPRAFRVPFVPLIPILGVIVCLFMMVFLPYDTWIRLIVWMVIGMDIYLLYGMKHSKINDGRILGNKGGLHAVHAVDWGSIKRVGWVSIGMCLLLLVLTLVHQYQYPGEELSLYYFSLMFGGFHMILFAAVMVKNYNKLVRNN